MKLTDEWTLTHNWLDDAKLTSGDGATTLCPRQLFEGTPALDETPVLQDDTVVPINEASQSAIVEQNGEPIVEAAAPARRSVRQRLQ